MVEEMTCHNGHTSIKGLWNCPVCTDPKLDVARILKDACVESLELVESMAAQIISPKNTPVHQLEKRLKEVLERAMKVGL